MPTLNDLYYTFIGNKDLNPEYTTQYDFGVSYLRTTEKGGVKSFEIRADAYYNEVTDKIIAMPTSNQFRWTMINLGFVKIKGIDATAGINWQFGEVGIDSTLSSFDDKYYYPRYGYGTKLGCYLNSKVQVNNLALSGRDAPMKPCLHPGC